MCIESTELNVIKISHNLIEISNQSKFQLLVDLLRSVSQLVYLDFSYNRIGDSAIESIEKSLVFARDPPVK